MRFREKELSDALSMVSSRLYGRAAFKKVTED